MNNSKSAIMITLFASMSQGQNHYTVGSIKKFLQLLSKYHKINIRRRWMFQCLKDLLDAGLISRKQRYRKQEKGLISQIPSMISFTLKGAKYLVSKRVSGAIRMLKTMLKFVTGDDQRWPRVEDVIHPPTRGKEKKNQRELTKLLNNIGAIL